MNEALSTLKASNGRPSKSRIPLRSTIPPWLHRQEGNKTIITSLHGVQLVLLMDSLMLKKEGAMNKRFPTFWAFKELLTSELLRKLIDGMDVNLRLCVFATVNTLSDVDILMTCEICEIRKSQPTVLTFIDCVIWVILLGLLQI